MYDLQIFYPIQQFSILYLLLMSFGEHIFKFFWCSIYPIFFFYCIITFICLLPIQSNEYPCVFFLKFYYLGPYINIKF